MAQRVTRLEGDLEYLHAIVDGGEVQSREAVVALVGLIVSFAAKSCALDYDRLIAFLSDENDPQRYPEDRTELLLHGVRLILVYHRDLEKDTRESTPAKLGDDENRAILRRAVATLNFECETRAVERDRPRARKDRPQKETKQQLPS